MTTLTRTVYTYKRLGKWAIGLIIVIVSVLVFIRLIGYIFNLITPDKAAPAAVAFGILSRLDVSEGYGFLSDTQFPIDTISGSLPNFDRYAKVFVVEKPVARFGDLEKAIEAARRADFDETPIEVIGGTVKFKGKNNDAKILTIGITNFSVVLDSDYLRNPAVVVNRPQSALDAQKAVLAFWENLNLPLTNFPEDKITSENVIIENGILEKANSLSKANLVRVIFNKRDIEGKPIINPNFDNPVVWGLTDDKDVYAAHFTTFDIKKHRFSTYPIKLAEVALSDLKKGQGALNKKPSSNIFTITDVKLGYLETASYQPYLRPVYLFFSDDETFAYVDAVEGSWVSKN